MLTAAEAKALTDELAQLSRQQSEALQTAAYFTMSKTDAAAYDKRREHIAQLGELLRNYEP